VVTAVDVFLERLGPRAREVDRAAVAPVLDACIAAARAAWPALTLDEGAFAAHVAERLPPDVPVAAALATVRGPDLHLALACARRDPRAIAAFEETFAGEIAAAAAQVRAARVTKDELFQMLATRLFAEHDPKIREYAGVGKLRSWVRVAAVRMLLDGARKKSGGEAPMAPEKIPDVVDDAADPELAFMKRAYHEEMQRAFEEAARALSPEARNLLRHHHAHGMTIDELAAAHGIHRATAARRLVAAREELLATTRRRLSARLGLVGAELDSVVRLVESQLHVTIERVFAASD
jgi:RNA polymerase sigma-70 factor (ECF subfamily)